MTRHPNRFTMVALSALLAAANSAHAADAASGTDALPAPGPARKVSIPVAQDKLLPNGLRVVVARRTATPLVSVALYVRSGAEIDPPSLAGLTDLTAGLLDQGTTTRSAQQVADQIDSIGGAMGTGSGTDLTFVNAVVMKDSFALAMDLVSDVIRRPAFSLEEIERQREQALSSLKVSVEDPSYVASMLFDRLVYGFHPYGRPGSGTPQSLQRITQDDLRAFHRQYFVPNNMILGIVGDISSDEAFAAAEKVFGAWPRGDVPAWKPVDPPPPTRRLVIVDKPDAVQTEIRVGQIAIPRKHPDYLAFDVAVKILGGEGANRLHRVLRSERGLTYGAEADTQAFKQAGDFVAETNTRTETTAETLRLTVEEVAKLQRQRVFERELADAQAYLAGSFPLTIETPNDIATSVINAVFYELPTDEVATYRERVQAITPDDIQRVAREYIRPDRLSMVLVGNAKAFVASLRDVGFSDYDVIALDDLDLMSATLKKEPRAP